MNVALRYLLALPSAMIVTVLATFPIHWLVLVLHSCNSDGIVSNDGECSKGLWSIIDIETLERLGYAAFLPAVFVYVISRTIPSRSKWIPAFFATVWTITAVGFLAWATTDDYSIKTGNKLDYAGFGWIEFGFVVLFHFMSSGIIAVVMFKERDKVSRTRVHRQPTENPKP